MTVRNHIGNNNTNIISHLCKERWPCNIFSLLKKFCVNKIRMKSLIKQFTIQKFEFCICEFTTTTHYAKIIEEIKTAKNFIGFNVKLVQWLLSLGVAEQRFGISFTSPNWFAQFVSVSMWVLNTLLDIRALCYSI